MPEPNIHVSEAARAFAEARASEQGLDGPDQFVESLVERAMRREERRERLEALLMEGINSGPSKPLGPEEWASIRREAMDRLADAE